MNTKENLLLNVTYTTKLGKRTAFLNALTQLGVVEKSKQEPGNLRYDYYYPIDSEDQLLLVEIWADEEALAFHAQTEHYQQLQAIKGDYLINASIEKLYIRSCQ
ncbi:MAG: antibiotic biosynthesis monooxygenase [Acetobacterium woodii]|nr:antibiotic biosynthesis monooxygenase [Acetobacterium woodii]